MKVTNGSMVKVLYKGTLSDGREFDNSHTRGQTLDFKVGAGQMIKGFNDAVIGMTKGQTKSFTILAEDAYGEYNPEEEERNLYYEHIQELLDAINYLAMQVVKIKKLAEKGGNIYLRKENEK